MKLKLKKIASIAEVIGAIAIVISLIYVGIQVNDSTRAVRSATATETSAAISSWYAEVGSNSEATRILLNVMNDPESASREEALQFVYMIHGLMTEYQIAYYLSQEQTLDVQLRESLVNTITGVREQPGFLMYWQQRRDLFDPGFPGFRTFMDDLITNGETNTNLEQIYLPPKSE
jgi:hypothetical protein